MRLLSSCEGSTNENCDMPRSCCCCCGSSSSSSSDEFVKSMLLPRLGMLCSNLSRCSNLVPLSPLDAGAVNRSRSMHHKQTPNTTTHTDADISWTCNRNFAPMRRLFGASGVRHRSRVTNEAWMRTRRPPAELVCKQAELNRGIYKGSFVSM